MKPMSKEEHRKVLLDLTSEIHRVCDEHGLVYVIQGGTLLGAVRHGGFIPWDDDIDIMMPRYDYDMLVEHFSEWTIHPEYSMHAPALKNSVQHWAKLEDTTTYVKQTYLAEEFCTGAWIDILPLDSLTDATPEVWKKVAQSKKLCYAYSTDKNNASTPLVRVAKTLGQPLVRAIVNPYELANRTDQLIRKQSAEPSDTLVSYTGTHSFIHTCPADQIFNRTLFAFEDRQYWGPTDFDGALTIEFGPDWRTPVREESHSEDESRFFL